MPNPARMPSLICFDLGGVLVRTCRTWREGCAAAGLPVRGDGDAHEVELALVGVHHELQLGRIDGATMATSLSDAVSGLYSAAEIRAVHQAWLLGEYDGVREIVDGLHALGIATAALSNTDQEHWARLPEFPTVGRLRHRLASHELGLRKPDPEIYRALETHTGRAGDDVLFFDDLEENVEQASDLGWRALRIDPHADTAAQIRHALAEHGIVV